MAVKPQKITAFNETMREVSIWLNSQKKCSSTELIHGTMLMYKYFNPYGMPWYSWCGLKKAMDFNNINKYYSETDGDALIINELTDVVYVYEKTDPKTKVVKTILLYVHPNEDMTFITPYIQNCEYKFAFAVTPCLFNKQDNRLKSILDIENNVGRKNAFKNKAQLVQETYTLTESVADVINKKYNLTGGRDPIKANGPHFHEYTIFEKHADGTVTELPLFYFTLYGLIQDDVNEITLADIHFQNSFELKYYNYMRDPSDPPKYAIHTFNRIDIKEYESLANEEKSQAASTVKTTQTNLGPINRRIVTDNGSLTGKAAKIFNGVVDKAKNILTPQSETTVQSDTPNFNQFSQYKYDKFLQKNNTPPPSTPSVQRVPLRINTMKSANRTYDNVSKVISSIPEDREV